MIRKGHIKLTLQDWRNFPATYARKLHITFTELDKIAKEDAKREADKASRGMH